MPEIVVVDVATGAVRVVAAGRPRGSSRRPGGRTAARSSRQSRRTTRRSTCSSSASTDRPCAAADAHDRRRDLAGCLAGRPDDRLRRLHRPTASTCSPCRIRPAGAAAESVQPMRPRPRRRTSRKSSPTPRPSSKSARATRSAYSPLSTLTPTSWIAGCRDRYDQVRVGAATGGVDVLGYHAYAASATWLVTGPDGAPTPTPRRRTGRCSTPTTAGGRRSSRHVERDVVLRRARRPTPARRRPRHGASGSFEAGVLFPFRHARVRARGAGRRSFARWTTTRCADGSRVARTGLPLRAGWQTITGAHATATRSAASTASPPAPTAEIVRRGLGSFADATTLTADARGYLPGVRAASRRRRCASAAARRTGDRDGRPHLPARRRPPADERRRLRQQRVQPAARLRAATRSPAATSRSSNAEYRWPLARPQRGVGTLAALPAHRPRARCSPTPAMRGRGRSAPARSRRRLGGELSADVVAGYSLPFTLTVGAAWGRDGSGRVADRRDGLRRASGSAFCRPSDDLIVRA